MMDIDTLKFPQLDNRFAEKYLYKKYLYIVDFPDGPQIYIVRPGFFTTRVPYKFPTVGLKTLTEKELFEIDDELLETILPEFTLSHTFVKKKIDTDLFPKDPLSLCIVKEDDIANRFLKFSGNTEVYLIMTNVAKLRSFFEEKANSLSHESLYILYPFEKIKSKYISISWEDSRAVLVFSRIGEGREERKEFDCFLSFFKRYVKFSCDVDLIEVMEF